MRLEELVKKESEYDKKKTKDFNFLVCRRLDKMFMDERIDKEIRNEHYNNYREELSKISTYAEK